MQVEEGMACIDHTSLPIRLFRLLMAQSIRVGAEAEAEGGLISIR